MPALEAETRQKLVDDLLSGPALGRSEQLRQLLRYMAAEEAAGRGHELSEYSIGVNGLGRPAGYAPEVDSTVRTRVLELRKRLDEHYRLHPSSEGRLELPKGTYRLRFVAPSAVPAVAPEIPALPVESRSESRAGWRFTGGLLAGLAIAGLAWFAMHNWTPLAERSVRAIWGPALHKGEAISVVLATAPQLWIREFGGLPVPQGDPPLHFAAPDTEAFRDWYQRIMARRPNGLILHPNHHSPMGGEANAAVALAAFAAERGARVELLVGENLSATEIRERNAVVLGRAEYCRAAAALQPANGYCVRYVPERRSVGVVLPDDRGFFREDHGKINYGLVTVLSKVTAAGPRRSVLIAGINSDGSEAAMSYMTTPTRLVELESELLQTNGAVPTDFQVVIRSRSSDTRSLNAERVLVRKLN